MPDLSHTFSNIYAYVQNSLAAATSSYGNGLLTYVIAPLGLAATVYFLLLGYGILRGAIQAPVRELTWQIGKVGLVFAACSATFYSSVIVSGVPQIATSLISAGGGSATNPGTTFDTYMADATKVVQNMTAAQGQIDNAAVTSSSLWPASLTTLYPDLLVSIWCIIIYLFAFISALFGFVIDVFALLGVQICVAIAPLAFASLLFNASRWFFDGWMRQTINYSLLMVIMSIVTKFVTGMEQSVLDSLLTQANSASAFITAGATPSINAAAIELAGIACCVIYTVGSVFFFETPRISSGIVGGAASGGHGFLQSASNAAMIRVFRRSRG